MIIYKITNLINSKIYIGQTIRTLNDRIYDHFRYRNKKYKSAIKSAIDKYGEENFKVEVICETNSIIELNELEEKYINYFNSLSPFGYNLKHGGDNKKLSNETKEKISKSKKGKPNNSSFKFKKGMAPWNKNTKGLQTSWCKGLKVPKISKALKGIKKSEYHRQNLSKSKKKWYKNNRHSQSKYVLWIDRNIIFESATDAAIYLGCKQAHISRVCTGKRKAYKGFKFEYIDISD